MTDTLVKCAGIEEDKRKAETTTFIQKIYIFLMSLALSSHLWLLATNTGNNMPAYIWIIRLLPVPFAFCLGKLWKDRGFLLLFLYFLLFFFRCYIPNPERIFSEEISESILSAIWLFAACYGLGKVLNLQQLKLFLFICASVWTIVIVSFSCIGLYAVWTDRSVIISENALIGIDSNRLRIVYLATTTGSILSLSSLIAITVAVASNGKIIKKLAVIFFVPLIVSLALTDARTSYVMVSCGLCVLIFIFFVYYQKIRKNNEISIKNWRVWVLVLLVLILFFVFVVGIMQITRVFNLLKAQGLISKAIAEDSNNNVISTRGFEGSRVLSGRVELWQKIFEQITQNPKILLIGKSKYNPLSEIQYYYTGHSHSIYLQILVESGLPGLFLFCCFLVYLVIAIFRVVRAEKTPQWVKMLPVFPISLLLGDAVECFVWLRSSQCPMITVFFISCGIICSVGYHPELCEGNQNIGPLK